MKKWRETHGVSGRSHKADERVWRAALEWTKVKLENYTVEYVLYFIDNELEE